jgi:hypothetical protein
MMVSATRNVVAKNNDQVWLELIRPLDDQAQLSLVDEPSTGVIRVISVSLWLL